MGTTKKADMMINNGTDYDKILFSTTAEQVEYVNADGTTSDLQAKVGTLAGKIPVIKTLYMEGGKTANIGFSAGSQYRSFAWLIGALGATGTILTIFPLNLNAVTTTLTAISGVINLGNQTTIGGSIAKEGTGYRLKLSGLSATQASMVSICLPENMELLYADIVSG